MIQLISVLVPVFLFELALFAGKPLVSLRLGELNAAPGTIGVVLAVAGLAPLLFGIPAGGLTDRFGPRRVFIGGSLGAGLGYVGLAVTASPWTVALFLGIALTGITACIVASQTMVVMVGPPDQRIQNLGWFGTVVAMAQLTGPAIGGLVGDQFGLTTVFWACAGAGVFAFALAPLLPSPRQQHTARAPLTLQAGLQLLRPAQMRYVLLAAFLILLAFDVRVSFFPLFLDTLGLSRTQIGLVFTAQALVGIAVRPLIGRLTGRFGAWPLLTAALLLPAPAFFVLPTMTTFWGIVLTAAALGLTTGISQPLTMSLAVEQAPRSEHGLALGVRLTSQHLGSALSPVLLGFVASTGGLAAAFVAAGAISLGALLASALGWRSWRQAKSRQLPVHRP